MKCKVCGSEIGNRRFCNMCGAEASFESAPLKQVEDSSENLRRSMIGQSGPLKMMYTEDGVYNEKNILKTESVDDNLNIDGTTVLTDEDSFGIYSGTVYGKTDPEEKVIKKYVKEKSRKELRKELKEKKKAEQGYVNKIPFIVTIIVLAVLTVGLTVALIYYIFWGNKVYLEVLADVDSTIYAYSENEDSVMLCDGSGNKLVGINNAEKVAEDDTSLIKYNENNELLYQNINGTEENFGNVIDYYANPNLTTIVTIIKETDKISLNFFYDGQLLSNIGSFDNVRDVRVSDSGGYFSFCTDYTETRWEKDSSLPQGGQYVPVYMNDVYVVNYNGETRKILTSEVKLVPEYITSTGQLFYTDTDTKKLYVYQDGENDEILYNVHNIIFYENLSAYVILTNDSELWYGTFLEARQKPYMIATEVEDLYIVGGNKKYDEYRDIERSYKITKSCAVYDTDVLIIYAKNGSTFINEPSLKLDSVKLNASPDDMESFLKYDNTAYYKAGGLLYKMDKDSLVSSVEDKRTGEVINTYNWSYGYALVEIGDGYYEILNDGKVLLLQGGTLSFYNGKDIQEFDEGVMLCSVNDSSYGFMYVKNTGELYYSMGPDTGKPEKMCDVSTVTELIVTNGTAYYREGDGNVKMINTNDRVVTEIADTANTNLRIVRYFKYDDMEDKS